MIEELPFKGTVFFKFDNTACEKDGTRECQATEFNFSKCVLYFLNFKRDNICAEKNGWELTGNKKDVGASVCKVQGKPIAVPATVTHVGDCSRGKFVDSSGFILGPGP